MRVLSLCSGYGGLELALESLLQDRIELVGTCDIYGPAREVLMHRFPESPVYRDVHDPPLESVPADVVTFGFPCQDLSRAGKGAGLNGTRSGLFFRCVEVGASAGAHTLVIENVPQALRYRETVDAWLKRYGYDPRWGRARASEAGLPHRRDRVFIVASRDWSLPPDLLEQGPQEPREPQAELLPTPTVVDMGWGRTTDEWESWRAAQREKHRNGNGHGQSLYQALGCPEPADACLRMEEMMGLPRGWVTDLGITIAAQRRLLGNGVAPAQGALGIHRAITDPVSN